MSKLDKLALLLPMTEIEGSAQQQIYDALELPFLKKLAIMPDVHTGYSLPIGGVALLDGVISPGYIGYDIGCGMCTVITAMPINEIYNKQQKIFKKIYEEIPVGFSGRETTLPFEPYNNIMLDKEPLDKVRNKLGSQMGTLGSGNHFIEIGENNSGRLCITIHSGSRNVGHTIASFYMSLSKNVDKHLPNGFLDVSGDYGKAYLSDMNYCLRWALDNRKAMMSVVLKILGLTKSEIDYDLTKMINENHNHAEIWEDGILHRKGATPSESGQLGVIPGNMRDGVYIVRGLGNMDFLKSSSHGAGRKYSRKGAKEKFTIEQMRKAMENIFAKVDSGTLDECPFAYKKIESVIKKQEGIVVDVVDLIKPKINIKG